jgi:predicted tellurium resistance membrane protein TerC
LAEGADCGELSREANLRHPPAGRFALALMAAPLVAAGTLVLAAALILIIMLAPLATPAAQSMVQLLALGSDPSAWFALVTLAAMEIVLSVDNLVIIALLSSKLPPKEAAKARQIGLSFSLILRLLLLSGAAYVIRLTAPLFTIFAHSFSFRDVMFAAGGLFLVLKATIEIHHATDPRERAGPETGRRSAFPLTAGQIVFFDLVFSIDSIITAVGMTEQIPIMFGAVIIAVLVMLLASGPIARFIGRNPAIVILALGFLLLIGTALIADGFGFHLPRGYIYAAMAFSAFIEGLHMLARKRRMAEPGHQNSGALQARKKRNRPLE